MAGSCRIKGNNSNNKELPQGNKIININLFTSTNRTSHQANEFDLEQTFTTLLLASL